MIAGAQAFHALAIRFEISSALTLAFNKLLHLFFMERAKHDISRFVLLHDDIVLQDVHWLTLLCEEMDRHELDVLSAVVPIKDENGYTSTAAQWDTGEGRIRRRLTVAETVGKLPKTFTADEVGQLFGHPVTLLANTGLMMVRMGNWVKDVCFTTENGVYYGESVEAMFHPEDWLFSEWLADRGIAYGATSAVKVAHMGTTYFANDKVWGLEQDEERIVRPSSQPRIRRPPQGVPAEAVQIGMEAVGGL